LQSATHKHFNKTFCCNGCKTVFDILNDNDLPYYYDLERAPGISPNISKNKYDFLQNEAIVSTLLDFNENNLQSVSLSIQSIHCSSCIWVLENLNKLNRVIKTAQVNFIKKTVRITYDSDKLNLKGLVILLSRIGYEPYISLDDAFKKNTKNR